MFFNGMQKYKYIVQIDMDKVTDAIVKYCCHQLLECRGHVTIAHLHHLAPECAKDCCKSCLVDMLWYDVYLFIHFGHITF